MSLTPEQIAAREGKLTASRVSCLMTGVSEEIIALYLEMVGDPSFVPKDLSRVWSVQRGVVTEPLNRLWYSLKAGRELTRVGEVVIHPTVDWAACTLDGFDDGIPAPVECKDVGGFEPRQKVLERYMPQTHWQMDITGTKQCILSIIEGGREPILEVIEHNQAYSDELWQRATQFMECVRTLTLPCALSPVAAPAVPEKIYDMQGRNEWASEAVTWLETYKHAKRASTAEKSLKSMVPADAKRVYGHSVEIVRDRAGRLSLREVKS